MIFRVHVKATNQIVDFEANRLIADSGMLCLIGEDDEPVIVLAAGEWKGCWPVTTEEQRPELGLTEWVLTEARLQIDEASFRVAEDHLVPTEVSPENPTEK